MDLFIVIFLIAKKLYSMVCSSSSCLLLLLGVGVYKESYPLFSRYSSAGDQLLNWSL